MSKRKRKPSTATQLIASLNDEHLSASRAKSLLAPMIVRYLTHPEHLQQTNIEQACLEVRLLQERLFKVLDYAEQISTE